MTQHSSIGFHAELKDKYDHEKNLLQNVTVEDIRKFGMIPEFIGRLPIIFTLNALTKEMLVDILKEPKNAILKQYQKLLALDEVDLQFEDGALTAIAEKALEKDTGARALRAIIEKFMLDIMYEIPKDDNIGRVTITEDYIRNNGAPLIEMRPYLQLEQKEYVARTVMKINCEMPGTYVFSSGKNMGAFKAVGFPEDVGVFYKLDEYEGYSWTAHGRYPTNTPGWWGGAHPFTLLDYSIVHNGEISSYDANRRFIEMFGYQCTLQTDTEVITYIMDYLLRVQKLSLGEAASVIAAPFWSSIENKTDLYDKKKHEFLRTVFPSLLITGPFSIVFGFNGGLMALNDRLKLRSMVVGEKDDKVFVASEEAAIRVMEPNAENMYAPAGGEPVMIKVKKGVF